MSYNIPTLLIINHLNFGLEKFLLAWSRMPGGSIPNNATGFLEIKELDIMINLYAVELYHFGLVSFLGEAVVRIVGHCSKDSSSDVSCKAKLYHSESSICIKKYHSI